MTFYDAKTKAKQILKSKLGEAIALSIIYSILLGLLDLIAGIGGLLFGSILLMGYYTCLIDLGTNKKFAIEKMFSQLNGETFTTRMIISIIKRVYLFLWSLLFFIPGIIKSYSYMLTELIAMKEPDLTPTECINESRRLMDGHKMNMFVLDLSFIGWHLLCILTFGIGYIFLTPYINQTKIEYINANILQIREE